MGAWGTGTFENDNALDWAGELGKSTDFSVLETALEEVVSATGYLEAPQCSEALAAAEVVAALCGRSGEDLPEEILPFLHGRARPAPALVSAAKKAVARIARGSELLELWQESDEFEGWKRGVEDLDRRLGGS